MVGHTSRKGGPLDSILAHCTSLAPLVQSNLIEIQSNFLREFLSPVDVVSVSIELEFLFCHTA
jgi:hypothetical protein